METAFERYQRGVEALDVGDLAVMVATLDQVTLANFSRLGLSGLGGKVMGMLGRGGDEGVSERLATAVANKAAELSKVHDAEALRLELASKLSDRLRVKEPFGEGWFTKVLAEVAPAFKVRTGGVPSDILANRVFAAILDDLIKQLQKTTKSMSPEERSQLIKGLQEHLEGLTTEERQQLTSALNLNELTAETVFSALQAGLLTAGGLAVTNALRGQLITLLGRLLWVIVLRAIPLFGGMATLAAANFVFVGMQRLLFFFLNPVVGAVLTVGSAGYAVRGQSRELDRKVAGLVLFQVAYRLD